MSRYRFVFCLVLFLPLFTGGSVPSSSASTGASAKSVADQKDKDKDKDKDITVEGEIVDVYCYMTHHEGSGKGAEHARCANGCIRKGGVVGFVSEDGDLYMLLNSNSAPLKTRVAGLAGRKVKVSGSKIERNNVEAIVVRSITRVRQTS